jgi:SAM-dependent methyltransferase
VKENVAGWLDRAIETVARARAPKEPPIAPGGGRENETLERPSCPLCGGTRGKVVLTKPPFAVVRCEVCSVRYTSPRYRRSARDLAYGPEYPYYRRAKAALEHVRPIDRSIGARLFGSRAGRLAEIEPNPGRILDVGCGDGFFLDVMRGRGWDVFGVDIEELVIRHARDILDVPSARLDAEKDPLPTGPFDAVTIWGALQLMYRPQRLLERIRPLLAPGGLLAIGVSNIKSVGAIFFRDHWHGLQLPTHLVHFTPETLKRVVEWSGYRVVGMRFETPRWITFGSIDDIDFETRSRRRAAKLAASAIGLLSERTRYGDTMELYARAQ